MEPIYRNQYKVSFLETDCTGRCRLSTLLAYSQQCAGEQCVLLGCGREALTEKGLFWAVTRLRMQVSRLPLEGETVTVETWPMPATKAAFPRSTVGYDENGGELFRAVSLWVLMDAGKRSLVLPSRSGVHVDGTVIGGELAIPGGLIPLDAPQSVTRTVRFSQLDCNGHMNNARYLDWVCDLLPAQFHAAHTPADLMICYLNEAREGQAVTLGWQMSESGDLRVDARGEEGKRIFSAQVRY